MDTQIKKGLIEMCVLAALMRADSYGYQIIKDVGEVVEISESTLYPILRRLEGGGLVNTYQVAHNGRLRKYFKITQNGVGKLKQFEGDQYELMQIYRFISESLEGK